MQKFEHFLLNKLNRSFVLLFGRSHPFYDYSKGFQVQRHMFTSACPLSNGVPWGHIRAFIIADHGWITALRAISRSVIMNHHSPWATCRGDKLEKEERNANALRSIEDRRCLDGRVSYLVSRRTSSTMTSQSVLLHI